MVRRAVSIIGERNFKSERLPYYLLRYIFELNLKKNGKIFMENEKEVVKPLLRP